MVMCGSNLRSERVSGEVTHRVTILKAPRSEIGHKFEITNSHWVESAHYECLRGCCCRFAVLGSMVADVIGKSS